GQHSPLHIRQLMTTHHADMIPHQNHLKTRPRGAAVGAACALLAIVGATGTSAAPLSPTAGVSTVTVDSAEVRIKDFKFAPAELKVSAGAKITVTNEDSAPHTLTATDAYAFDTGTIEAGKSATFTAPSEPGSYPFFCSFHPQMKGTLIVS
ncbi:cupredoxin family copper-binding protein, partial [Streptomyces sp. NPDC091371]|uniref:cupredoxin domain-containing protein n=1 Tax=Streptomyces sp. NPDC091371 TaxID=3155303 RepID=UPI0034165FEF